MEVTVNSKSSSSTPLPKFIWIAFLTIFLDLLGFGILIPIMPFFAKSFEASPTVIAWLGTIYSLMQFIFTPFWGRLSDRVGRRPVVLFSIAISFIGHLIFANADTLWMLIAARGIIGFGNANIAVAQAIVSDVTDASNRGKGMGLIGVAFGLGFVFGPAIGGSLAQIDATTPAMVAACLALINGLLAYFYLPETFQVSKDKSPTTHRPFFSIKAVIQAAKSPNIKILFFWMLVATTAFSMMEYILGLYILEYWPDGFHTADIEHGSMQNRFDSLKGAAARTAIVLFVVGITAIVVQGGLIGRFIKKFGEVKLVKSGTLIYALALASIPLSGYFGSFELLLFISVWIALASGLTNPCVPSILSQESNRDEQGSVLGLGQSLSSLGRVLGPTLTGVFFEINPALPFLVSGSLMFLAAWMVFGLKNRV